MTSEGMKACIGKDCTLVVALSEAHLHFYKVKSNPDGFHKYCKPCCKVSRARENVRKRDRRSKISMRQHIRVKGLNLEVDKTVTLDAIYRRDKGICALCNKWVQPKHASMDHINPVKYNEEGHTWDNVQLVHIKCNLRKGANKDYKG